MFPLKKSRMLIGNNSLLMRVTVYLMNWFLLAALISDVTIYCFCQVHRFYALVKEKLLFDGDSHWRCLMNKFFSWYFAYYQEEVVDFDKRPELRGLMTDWMSADELVKHIKLGDLLEFKGTTTGMTLFHHWSVCVRVNTEIDAHKRIPTHVRMLHLSRVGNKSLTGGDLFNFGIVFVSAKIHIKSLAETHLTRRCRINNSLDLRWQPFPGRDVAKFALTWRGCARYNGTLWNCEHFVKCCRYGHGESLQTEMISSLVVFIAIVMMFLSLIKLPTWLCLYCMCMSALVYYYGMYIWRCLENAVFVFMRKHNIPISIFNFPLCLPKMTLFELHCTFCLWLFSIALRLYYILFTLQFWNIELFPEFSTDR